jgi:hypothetical protein
MGRFVVLSFLLHTLLVLLFGDATGGRQDGSGWARSFVATIERAASLPMPFALPGGSRSTRASAGPVEGPTLSTPTPDLPVLPPEAVPVVSSAPQTAVETIKPVEIEKIPAIAIDTPGANSPFSVAPIAIAPIVAAPIPPATTASPPAAVAIPTISAVDAPTVKRDNTEFAIYVPPIVERATITPPKLLVPATPTLAPIEKPKVDRDFATYTPPPVVVTPPPVPVAAVPAGVLADTRTTSQDMLVPTPAVPSSLGPIAEPATPLKPIEAKPIEPLKPTAANVQPESYRPRDVETTAQSTATTATAAKEVERAPATPARVERGLPSAPTPAAPLTPSGVGPSAIFNAPLPPPPTQVPPASTAPRLDLDALRRQAREVAREGSGPRTLMPFPTVAKEATKKDMEKIFDKALKRPDCKEVYADLGLAAVVPLVRDAVKDGGCKW